MTRFQFERKNILSISTKLKGSHNLHKIIGMDIGKNEIYLEIQVINDYTTAELIKNINQHIIEMSEPDYGQFIKSRSNS